MWVGGKEVGDPAPFTLLLGFYGLSRNPRQPSALGANVVGVHMRKNISGGPRMLVTSRYFRVDCPSN